MSEPLQHGNVYERQQDGTWRKAEPIGPQGWKAKVEFWLRDRQRLPRVANFLGSWDERKLGR